MRWIVSPPLSKGAANGEPVGGGKPALDYIASFAARWVRVYRQVSGVPNPSVGVRVEQVACTQQVSGANTCGVHLTQNSVAVFRGVSPRDYVDVQTLELRTRLVRELAAWELHTAPDA